MTSTPAAPIGTIGWFDLTVADAVRLRDFYADVVGWTPASHDMGGYSDFVMHAANGAPVAGVCHARGVNADLPPTWLAYFMVADVAASIAACVRHGGALITGPRQAGPYGTFAVLRDPAGAYSAVLEPSKAAAEKKPRRTRRKAVRAKRTKPTKRAKAIKKAKSRRR
jgi:uncharacterized protein